MSRPPRGFLLPIALLVAVTILVVSGVQYLLSRAHSIGQAESFATGTLKQISYSAQYMADTAHSLLGQLYLDPEVSALVNASYVDDEQVTRTVARLKSFANALDLVQSIYVYNASTGKVYSTVDGENGVIDVKRFFDGEVRDLLDHPEKIPLYTALSRVIRLPYIPSDRRIGYRVFSFFFVERDSSGRIDTALVVNLSEAWFRGVVAEIGGPQSGSILVIDSAGQLLSADTGESEAHPTDVEPVVERILQPSEGKTGSFLASWAGQSHLVSFTTLDKLGWKFVRLVPAQRIYADADRQFLETLGVSFLVLLLGFGLSVWIMGRVYRPVGQRIDRLEEQIRQDSGHRDEAKRAFLKRLLAGELDLGDLQTADQIDRLAIPFRPGESLTLVLLRIDHFRAYCDHNTLDQRKQLRDRVQGLCQEVFSGVSPLETVEWEADQIVVFLGTSGLSTTEVRDRLVQIQSLVGTRSGLSLTVALAPQVSFDETLADQVGHLHDQSWARFFCGFGRILEGPMAEPQADPFSQELLGRLVDNLSLQRFPETQEALSALVSSLEGHPASVVQPGLYRAQIQALAALESASWKWGISMTTEMGAYLSGMEDFETREELLGAFEALLSATQRKLADKRTNRHSALVGEVEGYIRQEYAQTGLCLDTVADHFVLSAAYLGRVYRQQTGHSIASYITEVRLDQARHRLVHTDLTNQEIAATTGFANTKYFFTLFKKNQGQTPQEYRRSRRAQSQGGAG